MTAVYIVLLVLAYPVLALATDLLFLGIGRLLGADR